MGMEKLIFDKGNTLTEEFYPTESKNVPQFKDE